jgi:uncharacterized repeat protein (TIGR01451 family)
MNEVCDADESALAGRTIKLWRGGMPYAETVTVAGGGYLFSGLLPGSYSVTEVQQGGWYNTVAPAGTFPVANGTARTGLNFGNVAIYPEIEVVKTANPTHVPETGGSVVFSFTITNHTSVFPVTVTSISYDVFGDLLLEAKSQNAGLDIVLAPGAQYTFSITRLLASNVLAPHTNTVTVIAYDDYGRFDTDDDDATVTFDDVPPVIVVTKTANPTSVPETGGNVLFTITVENTGTESVTLTGAVDTVFGPIDVALFDKQVIPVGGTAVYSFTEWMEGEPAAPHNNVVTVTAVDNDGTSVSDDDDADVTYIDLLPSVEVEKDVAPGYMDEPGGTFSYTVRVKNTSDESVKLMLVKDDVYGVIYEWAQEMPEIWLLPNEVKVFEFTMDHTDAGTYENTAEATVADNDGNSASDDDDATALVGDVGPVVDIDKTVDVSSLPEPGGVFTFTLTIKNMGVEPFTITSLTDTNLSEPYPAEVAALIGQTILVGGELFASYPITHTDAGEYDNTAVVEVIDNDESTDTDSDDESVTVIDVLPTVEVTKDVEPLDMNVPGGTFSYTVYVKNTSVESVKLGLVVDDTYGVIYDPAVEDADEIWLLPNEVKVFEFTMDHTEAGQYINIATATVTDNEGNSASDSDDAVVTVWNPAISVVKSSDAPDGLVARGTLVTYTYVVTNTGDVPLFDIVVTDDKLGVVGTLETLAVGASATFTASATLNDTTTNVVVATGEDLDGNEVSDEDIVTVETFVPFTPVDLAIEKIASGETFKPGDVITYTLRYQNLGTKPASDFTIVDDFDERYVSVIDAAGGTVAGGKITWTLAGPLAMADGVKTISYTVRVKSDMPEGTTKVSNVVVISHPDDDNPANDRDDASVNVKEPFLPFTGGEAAMLLLVALVSAVLGIFLRRRTA